MRAKLSELRGLEESHEYQSKSFISGFMLIKVNVFIHFELLSITKSLLITCIKNESHYD